MARLSLTVHLCLIIRKPLFHRMMQSRLWRTVKLLFQRLVVCDLKVGTQPSKVEWTFKFRLQLKWLLNRNSRVIASLLQNSGVGKWCQSRLTKSLFSILLIPRDWGRRVCKRWRGSRCRILIILISLSLARGVYEPTLACLYSVASFEF